MAQQTCSNPALLQAIDETIAYIDEYKDEYKDDKFEISRMEKNDSYNDEIINQLLSLEIGSKSQIIEAMKMVNDPNNIEEIAEYLLTNPVNMQYDDNIDNDDDDKINTLMTMGYDKNSCKIALEISNNNIEIAAQYLIDGVLNQNIMNINEPIIKPEPLKAIEIDDVNDTDNVFKGKLIQIIGTNHKDDIAKYWTECKLNDYDATIRGSVGIITDIFNNNNTIKIEICDKKQIIIPIKVCVSIKYEIYKENEDYMLISGYIDKILYNDNDEIRNIRNIPRLINQCILEYYHTSDLKLICSNAPKKEILITKEACKLSKYLNDIIFLTEYKINKLYLNNIPYDTMCLVFEYLTYHNGIKPAEIPCPVRSVIMEELVEDRWDANYMDSKDKKTIFEIILAANGLSCRSLLHLGSAKIATLIKKLDQTEINRIIEEEEQYRRDQIHR